MLFKCRVQTTLQAGSLHPLVAPCLATHRENPNLERELSWVKWVMWEHVGAWSLCSMLCLNLPRTDPKSRRLVRAWKPFNGLQLYDPEARSPGNLGESVEFPSSQVPPTSLSQVEKARLSDQRPGWMTCKILLSLTRSLERSLELPYFAVLRLLLALPERGLFYLTFEAASDVQEGPRVSSHQLRR